MTSIPESRRAGAGPAFVERAFPVLACEERLGLSWLIPREKTVTLPRTGVAETCASLSR
jgi:hypothetical protein